MQDLGKQLFFLGLVLTAIGGMLWQVGWLKGLGHLPGDIFVRKGNSTFYFPVVTCIVISLVLSLLSWLFRR